MIDFLLEMAGDLFFESFFEGILRVLWNLVFRRNTRRSENNAYSVLGLAVEVTQ